MKTYLIIQAGGKGTRMYSNTWNRPKALISVLGKPIIVHLINIFKSFRPIIIGDYYFNKIKLSLKYTYDFKNNIYIETSKQGSISGISDALRYLKKNNPILISWCDLFFFKKPKFSKKINCITIGVTDDFVCRYIVKNNIIQINKNNLKKNGIIGLFYVPCKKLIANISEEGEFVEWLKKSQLRFKTKKIKSVFELGDNGKLELFREKFENTRFFNSIRFKKKFIEKRSIVKKYNHLIKKEIYWYRKVYDKIPKNVPKLYKSKYIKIERIYGSSPSTCTKNKEKILLNIIDALKKLHSSSYVIASKQDLALEYFNKTQNRVMSVSRFIPNFKNTIIKINNVNCKNYFSPEYKKDFFEITKSLYDTKQFNFIHGDPTFSNILVEKDLNIKFIDPRGYFGNSKIYGDSRYDFAKLYYSIVGRFDNFNQKKFILKNFNNNTEVYILDNGWGDYSNIFNEFFKKDLESIKKIHALIWLSLTGYTIDDYDSVLASFYNGIFLLNQLDQ